MIKVLISDDERIVRKGLIATIDWNKFGMEVIGDASNGQRAWELFLEHSPEIIITDIVMPEMNGIELARKVKQHSPSAKILLLSCHRDFEYAQEGLNIGASGYILKTAFQDQEFEDYLERFQKELSYSKGQGQDDSALLRKEFYAWLCGFTNSFPKMLQNLFVADWNWKKEPYYIFLLSGMDCDEHIQLFSEQKRFAKIPCGQEQAFIFIPAETKETLEKCLIKEKSENSAVNWRVGGPFKGSEEWMEGVLYLYKLLKIEKQFKFSTEEWPLPIQQATKMMIEHLEQPLSSSDIAAKVGLSRSHFSTMFKKTVGESFIEFTERMRINTACDLLENTSLTQQEISEKIGIQDGKYFSKWFKKCTGKTPSDYRQNKKENFI
ncbi:response regulator [Bacillus sp. FJAT-18017]|uniref:response regulator n=1 Tax=Bacillus sp. FJAT-18017 TaxID=1705566 RepID=UPI0006ADE0C8|nr:response regulator [Bacillus sp. FJAT-18017]